MEKTIENNSALVEKLYGVCFAVFAVAVFLALLNDNFGQAIWLAIAASNSFSLILWANMKRKYEILAKAINQS